MNKALSSTSNKDTFHGLLCEAATVEQIHELEPLFADGARRARAAGLDGIELHASHGYLFTQFLELGDQRPERRIRRLARKPRAVSPRSYPGDPQGSGQ